ncbi:MAG TPA: hypothetical protein VH500_08285 [Nitrososphaeraceae archaeon]
MSEQTRFLDKVFDEMLTSAEINIASRPILQSFDALGSRISFLVIPTLEDLKYLLFEPEDQTEKYSHQSKVTTIQDIESASFMGVGGFDPVAIGIRKNLPTVIFNLRERVSHIARNFTEECHNQGGTIKVFGADGITEISLDKIFEKYYSN